MVLLCLCRISTDQWAREQLCLQCYYIGRAMSCVAVLSLSVPKTGEIVCIAVSLSGYWLFILFLFFFSVLLGIVVLFISVFFPSSQHFPHLLSVLLCNHHHHLWVLRTLWVNGFFQILNCCRNQQAVSYWVFVFCVIYRKEDWEESGGKHAFDVFGYRLKVHESQFLCRFWFCVIWKSERISLLILVVWCHLKAWKGSVCWF